MADRERCAIAVLFPEPDNELEFNVIVKKMREVFEGKTELKVLAAARNAADRIESILDSGPEQIDGDITIIGQDCITNGEGIVYKGDNFYKACDIWVTASDGTGLSFCVKRSGHAGYIHEDFEGRFRDATDDEKPDEPADLRDLLNRPGEEG